MAMEDTIIPKASADAYEKTYTAFLKWKEKMKITSNDDRVLLAYFKQEEELVKIEFYERKNKRFRTYYVGNSGDGPNVLTIIRTYLKLRKNVEGITQFLLQIRNGKITRQAVGKSTIANNCQEVARYLNLDNPETYTCHCNRRSSATAIAEAGVSFLDRCPLQKR